MTSSTVVYNKRKEGHSIRFYEFFFFGTIVQKKKNNNKKTTKVVPSSHVSPC